MTMNENQSRIFLETCLALSSEKDREELLSQILDAAMTITNCDAGTLYLLENDGLHFCRMVTKSMGVRQGGHAAPITLPPVPLEEKYVASWAIIHRQNINVADVRTDTRFDFSGSLRYDQMTGYRTGSMLVVPMCDDRQKYIGCMQLINSMGGDGPIAECFVPFSEDVELLVSAMASQAAISLTNMQYSEQIKQLLDSLVGALSTAIDARTPYNANHTRNMVRYGGRFLDKNAGTGSRWDFDEDKRRTFLMSVWLHDVGKLTTPLNVMNKESRLGDDLDAVLSRLEKVQLLTRIAALEGKFSKEEAENEIGWLKDASEHIKKINSAGFLPDSELAFVEELHAHTFTDTDGETKSLITENEYVCLQVRKGTLTAEERGIMESHVVYTAKILGQVTFPEIYSQVPQWASMHHELLNGKGYPNHVTSDDICKEVRLLTILDVFDALTAKDRPYKPGMPVEKAISILKSMVEEGGMDGEILDEFIKSEAWEE